MLDSLRTAWVARGEIAEALAVYGKSSRSTRQAVERGREEMSVRRGFVFDRGKCRRVHYPRFFILFVEAGLLGC